MLCEEKIRVTHEPLISQRSQLVPVPLVNVQKGNSDKTRGPPKKTPNHDNHENSETPPNFTIA